MTAASPSPSPTPSPDSVPTVTLGGLLGRFKGRISITLILVLFEAVTLLLFPLFIGWPSTASSKTISEG